MKLSDWARANGVHPKTAYRWWRNGTLPVPARQINARVILVDDAASTNRGAPELSAVGLYARVSSTTSGPISTARLPAFPSGQRRREPGCCASRPRSGRG
jgi:putative resolvase